MGTKHKLLQNAVLLDQKKQLQETFRLDQEKQGNADEGGDNGERITTFSKLDKMCCESLIFCEDTQLWKGVANQNCLYLRDDLSCINLEMTSVPLIGE